MRDDVFLIWKKGDPAINRKLGSDELDRFLWKLNCFEKRIEFTLEREKDGVMPFLDMLIKRERYIHWKSNHSQAVKLGV